VREADGTAKSGAAAEEAEGGNDWRLESKTIEGNWAGGLIVWLGRTGN
jgi:hypothetical protein